MKLFKQNQQIIFGTLNGLIYHLLIYLQIYQAKHNVYVKVYPHTIDATPLNYNTFFPDRAGNNSLNSTFIQQDNLNGTRKLTQQDI